MGIQHILFWSTMVIGPALLNNVNSGIFAFLGIMAVPAFLTSAFLTPLSIIFHSILQFNQISSYNTDNKKIEYLDRLVDIHAQFALSMVLGSLLTFLGKGLAYAFAAQLGYTAVRAEKLADSTETVVETYNVISDIKSVFDAEVNNDLISLLAGISELLKDSGQFYQIFWGFPQYASFLNGLGILSGIIHFALALIFKGISWYIQYL